MRYSKTHKDETRLKLLNSSRAITKKGGFSVTSVDTLMSAVGMTGGAFYNHFPSKQALFQAVIEEEVQNSREMLAGDENSSDDHVIKWLRKYLSVSHALHPDDGCVLPTLGPEIARSGPEVRSAVEAAVTGIQKAWSARTSDGDAAWAVIAQCIGALALARMVESEATREEILQANLRVIEKHHLHTPDDQ
ncbi:MAG: TetR family transcriptional regulator [Pseudomonas sp. PGPPP1]|uniref:TetR/AcrR family transcriptional regulator n=1 Tax=Pseudomonas sp. PGPPP1 TaxID=2015553 RepID=UPI000BCD4CCE|nr:TetR/AcrR family transcriptional regulator [Pseudomonas sp. PGPPP1]OYU09542.1 MAG: TetR family transcriptional regulator [Pseudomonas sp. PGPPP1]